MRVVLDTNALLSALPLRSRFHVILEYLNEGAFTLLITTDIYFEYIEILENKGNTMAVQFLETAILKEENITVIDSYFMWELIPEDRDDNKFCDCAVAGNADYLVTNDGHFNKLKNLEFPKINIITIEEFITVLTNKL